MSTVKIKRRFLGVSPTLEKPMISAFEKAHLKAYLKGKEQFGYGTTMINRELVVTKHKVKQEYYYPKN